MTGGAVAPNLSSARVGVVKPACTAGDSSTSLSVTGDTMALHSSSEVPVGAEVSASVGIVKPACIVGDSTTSLSVTGDAMAPNSSSEVPDGGEVSARVRVAKSNCVVGDSTTSIPNCVGRGSISLSSVNDSMELV